MMRLHELNEVYSNTVFLARSTICPKHMRYDHVGFMLSNGSQIQMSGHHDDNEVYMTKNVTDDPMFKSQALKKITLPKTVSIPTTNIFPDVQNCSGFVGAVLAQNGLPKLNAQYFNNLFKR